MTGTKPNSLEVQAITILAIVVAVFTVILANAGVMQPMAAAMLFGGVVGSMLSWLVGARQSGRLTVLAIQALSGASGAIVAAALFAATV